MTKRKKQIDTADSSKATTTPAHTKKRDSKSTPNKSNAVKNGEEIVTNDKSLDKTTNSSNISKDSILTHDDDKINNNINTPDKAKKFGTSNWCAANYLCKNQISAATYDYWCTSCHYSVHFECSKQDDLFENNNSVCLFCAAKEDKVSNSRGKHINDTLEEQPIITEMYKVNTLLNNDTSVIDNKGSFMDDNINQSNDDLKLSGILNGDFENISITRKLLQQLQNILDVTTVPNTVIQALYLAFGIAMETTDVIAPKLSTYIMKQQIWLHQEANINDYMNSNYYKILLKVLGKNNRYKQQIRKQNVDDVKSELLHEFSSYPIDNHMSLYNTIQLTKMNGVFVTDSTFTKEGKNRILTHLQQMTENSDIYHDEYSTDIFKQFLNKCEQGSNMMTPKIKGKQLKQIIDSRVTTEEQISNKVLFHPTKTENEKRTRFDIRLYIDEDNQKTDFLKLQQTLQAVVKKLESIDRSIVILPWFSSSDNEPMMFGQVPERLWDLNRFFPRMKPVKDGYVYGEFRMSHTKSYDIIIDAISPWLYDLKSGIYYHSLQCKLTTNLGWLMWSIRNIDTQSLEDELFKLYNIKVQLRYQNIGLSKGHPEGKEIVRALHVIVNKDHEDKISAILQQIYSFDTTHFPLGITMRFLPHINKISIKKENDIVKWRHRQKVFTDAIQNPNQQMMARTWEIKDLDIPILQQQSLRKILMDVKSTVNENEYLFLGVDVSYFRSNETLITFLPKHEQEARTFVTNLIPYIRHKHESIVLEKVFEEEAIKRSKDSIWNSDTQEVMSSADLYLEQSAAEDANFNMLEALGIDELSIRNNVTHNPEYNQVQRLFTGEDNTSIGSIFTQKKILLETNTPTNNRIITPSTNTVRSHSTTLTIEEVDTKITNLSTDMKQLHHMLSALLRNQNLQVTGVNSESTCEIPK